MSAKRVLFRTLHAAGVTRLMGWWNRRTVPILCYHGVTGRSDRVPGDTFGLHVRRYRFEDQMAFLQKHYRVISLSEYVGARRTGASIPPYTAVLTFDDGYRNVLTVAAPVLRRRGMAASFFVVTDWVDAAGSVAGPTDWEPADDERFLSWPDLQALSAAPSFEIGSHTCTHAMLPELASDDAERELRESLAAIHRHLDDGEVCLAYPKGRYDDDTARLSRRAGYPCGLTTDPGGNRPKVDLFALKRTLVGDDDDEAAFAVRLSGLGALLTRYRGA